jgi:serine protease inhibitor
MTRQIKKAKARSLAEAALRLSQRVHERYPQALITTLDIPYTDEDLTIEIALPEEYELREASDNLIRICLEIEDELGVSILTQVSRFTPEEEGTQSP